MCGQSRIYLDASRERYARLNQMLLDFDIKKAVAASAHLIKSRGGKEDMFVLIKILYYADRSALIQWGKSITGDSLASMDKGPVVSTIYDLLKGKGEEETLIQWSNFISRKSGYDIVLRKPANTAVLSTRELRVLDESSETIHAIHGSIPKWLHAHCPEWQDPHGSSIPIDPSQILRIAKKSEEQIREIEEVNEEVHLLNRLVGAR